MKPSAQNLIQWGWIILVQLQYNSSMCNSAPMHYCTVCSNIYPVGARMHYCTTTCNCHYSAMQLCSAADCCVQFAVCIVQCALCSVQCIVQSTVATTQCIVKMQNTVYNKCIAFQRWLDGSVYIVHCALCNAEHCSYSSYILHCKDGWMDVHFTQCNAEHCGACSALQSWLDGSVAWYIVHCAMQQLRIAL